MIAIPEIKPIAQTAVVISQDLHLFFVSTTIDTAIVYTNATYLKINKWNKLYYSFYFVYAHLMICLTMLVNPESNNTRNATDAHICALSPKQHEAVSYTRFKTNNKDTSGQ